MSTTCLEQGQRRLPLLLSVIAGMVDLTGFVSLGNVFTAHITGNLVVVAALVIRGDRINPDQVLAIPVFILAVAGTWLLARMSRLSGVRLLRLLLQAQCVLLTSVFVFSVITTPSSNPHGGMADIAAMMAVSAMACQFALLRVSLPDAPSTAVMTGNLTSAVLWSLNLMSRDGGSMSTDAATSRGSLSLLGFLGGCVIADAAVVYLGDWAWALPAVLAGVAVPRDVCPADPPDRGLRMPSSPS